MKNSKKNNLVYETNTLANLLFEQEEGGLFDDEEGGGEEEAAEEETAEDAEEGNEEAAEEEATDDSEEEADEEDEKLDVDLDDEVKLSKSIDQDLEALLIDFETDARKSKDIDDTVEEIQVSESLGLKMLLEQEDYEAEIDLERFSSEVARLVKNYTTLLDMEKMLVSKAREFVATRYGEKAEADLVDMLSVQHDISIEEPVSADSVPRGVTPIAVGAGSGAAGGAA